MLILANFLEAIAVVLDYALTLYMWVIIAGAVLSWVNHRNTTRRPIGYGLLQISPQPRMKVIK